MAWPRGDKPPPRGHATDMSDPHPPGLGSIPDQVMRQAACPVPAVPPRHTGRDLAGYELPDAPAMTGQDQVKTLS